MGEEYKIDKRQMIYSIVEDLALKMTTICNDELGIATIKLNKITSFLMEMQLENPNLKHKNTNKTKKLLELVNEIENLCNTISD